MSRDVYYKTITNYAKLQLHINPTPVAQVGMAGSSLQFEMMTSNQKSFPLPSCIFLFNTINSVLMYGYSKLFYFRRYS